MGSGHLGAGQKGARHFGVCQKVARSFRRLGRHFGVCQKVGRSFRGVRVRVRVRDILPRVAAPFCLAPSCRRPDGSGG